MGPLLENTFVHIELLRQINNPIVILIITNKSGSYQIYILSWSIETSALAHHHRRDLSLAAGRDPHQFVL
jgi:hypothetical protein